MRKKGKNCKICVTVLLISKIVIRRKTILDIKYYSLTHMIDETLNPKRIRAHAPYRKSIALTEEDIQRLSYMESAFRIRYPLDVPFSFSKTISKAIELAYLQLLSPNSQSMQQSLTGIPADHGALQDAKNKANQRKIGKFQKKK